MICGLVFGAERIMSHVMLGSAEDLKDYLNSLPNPRSEVVKTDPIGCPAISLARDAQIALVLLNAGADVHALNSNQQSALHCIAIFGPSRTETARFLIEQGASLSVQDKDGNTPLSLAAGNANLPLTELFLKKGASVNVANKDGNTALMMAIKAASADPDSSYIPVARALLSAGADRDIRNASGETAMSIAEHESLTSIVSLLKSKAEL